MRKAQFEVVGLLIIVILISLGVLFVVKFVLLSPPSTLKSSHVESQFASSFLNAFIETTSEDCHNQQMKGLIHDCASNDYAAYRILCNNLGTPLDSCDYLRTTANLILEETLIKDKRSFIFTISWDAGDKEYVHLEENVERCKTSSRIETKEIPLQVDSKDVFVRLELCN